MFWTEIPPSYYPGWKSSLTERPMQEESAVMKSLPRHSNDRVLFVSCCRQV